MLAFAEPFEVAGDQLLEFPQVLLAGGFGPYGECVGVSVQVELVDSETLERSVGKIQRLVEERGAQLDSDKWRLCAQTWRSSLQTRRSAEPYGAKTHVPEDVGPRERLLGLDILDELAARDLTQGPGENPVRPF